MKNKKVLFLGKKNDTNTTNAASVLKENFLEVFTYFGDWGDPFPEDLIYWNGEIIISYLSRWKIPKSLLDKTELCINFHPGSHEFPGIGCTNFALYNEAKIYGVCCHHISEDIDAGSIISVDPFPILPTDNVKSLLDKTYAYQMVQFYKIIDYIIQGKELPSSSLNWKRKPYKRSEFEELKIISTEMNEKEVAKRIRATSYGQFQPKIVIGNHTFDYHPEK